MNKRMKAKFVLDNKGSVVLIGMALVCVGATILMAMGVLENSVKQSKIESAKEARHKIMSRTKSYLGSLYITNYSFNVMNPPDANAELRQCIMGSVPAQSCATGLSVDFYQPLSNGSSERVVGGESNPVFMDQAGQPCLPADSSSGSPCHFKVYEKCQFICPGEQTVCPSLKVMNCDIEVAPISQTFLKKFVFKESYGQFATSSTIRLIRSGTSYAYLVTRE